MSDQNRCQATLTADPVDQCEHSHLSRHVQRTGRLVAQQHVGPAGQRHRDHCALPHPARELMWVSGQALPRGWYPDLTEQVSRAFQRTRAADILV